MRLCNVSRSKWLGAGVMTASTSAPRTCSINGSTARSSGQTSTTQPPSQAPHLYRLHLERNAHLRIDPRQRCRPCPHTAALSSRPPSEIRPRGPWPGPDPRSRTHRVPATARPRRSPPAVRPRESPARNRKPSQLSPSFERRPPIPARIHPNRRDQRSRAGDYLTHRIRMPERRNDHRHGIVFGNMLRHRKFRYLRSGNQFHGEHEP